MSSDSFAPPDPQADIPVAHSATHSSRVETALSVWRKRLLDLTKRNRALNFRPSKVSTVTIVDEQPAEVFRHLCIQGGAMRFRPTLPSAVKGGRGAAGAVVSEQNETPSGNASQSSED